MEVQDEERFDCHPDAPYSESECISRGCCWMPAHNPSHAQQGYPPVIELKKRSPFVNQN